MPAWSSFSCGLDVGALGFRVQRPREKALGVGENFETVEQQLVLLSFGVKLAMQHRTHADCWTWAIHLEFISGHKQGVWTESGIAKGLGRGQEAMEVVKLQQRCMPTQE